MSVSIFGFEIDKVGRLTSVISKQFLRFFGIDVLVCSGNGSHYYGVRPYHFHYFAFDDPAFTTQFEDEIYECRDPSQLGVFEEKLYDSNGVNLKGIHGPSGVL